LTGPTLQGVAKRLGKAELGQSILQPNAQLAEGFQVAMPSFAGVLTEQEVEDLLAYLLKLKH